MTLKGTPNLYWKGRRRSVEDRLKKSLSLRGRPKSDIACAHMSAARIGQAMSMDVRAKISKSLLGRKKPEAHRLAIKRGCLGILKSETSLAKQSKSMKLLWRDQEQRAKYCAAAVRRNQKGIASKHGYHISPKVPTGCIYYASSYEKRAFEILDGDGKVLSYRRSMLALPYQWSGACHLYIPDLEVHYNSGTDMVLEIKPMKLRTIQRNVEKEKAALHYAHENNLRFVVWTEGELFS